MESGENQTVIETIKSEKDLGVTTDMDKNFEKVNIANRKLKIKFKTFNFVYNDIYF